MTDDGQPLADRERELLDREAADIADAHARAAHANCDPGDCDSLAAELYRQTLRDSPGAGQESTASGSVDAPQGMVVPEDAPGPLRRPQRAMGDLWGRLSTTADEEGYRLEEVPELLTREWLGDCPLADLLGAIYAQAYSARYLTGPGDDCRRVLGACRRLLENLAENAVSANLRREAGGLARRIVEVIGHPAYDLPAAVETSRPQKSSLDLWAEVKAWHDGYRVGGDADGTPRPADAVVAPEVTDGR